MSSLKSLKMRTVDVARRAGCSVQQVRNLERDGVLSPATRTPKGYRVYGETHVQSVLAYQAFAVGAGPIEAKKIMRAVQQTFTSQALALIDEAHALLNTERKEIKHAREAVDLISSEEIDVFRPADVMSVSELASALGVRPSTLRHWHAENLVVPDRDRRDGARRYTPIQVRDARIVHQLRKAGYRIATLRALMPALGRAQRSNEVISALDARDAVIMRRSRALLEGAAALNAAFMLAIEANHVGPTHSLEKSP